jgi:alpha-L-fucosidase
MKHPHSITSGLFLAILVAVMQPTVPIHAANVAVAATNSASETVEARAARMAWWQEARFGMFIHFGIYAIPGRGEWVQWNEQIPVNEYAKLADQTR